MPQFSKSFLSVQQLISDNVAEAIVWLRAQGMNDDTAGSTEIVLAEALNNIVEHAYFYREDGQIELDLRIGGGDVLEITLFDQGSKFPGIPQKKEMKGNAIKFEELPEGGFGWFLIHSLTQSIRYAYVNEKNVVKFEVSCT